MARGLTEEDLDAQFEQFLKEVNNQKWIPLVFRNLQVCVFLCDGLVTLSECTLPLPIGSLDSFQLPHDPNKHKPTD